MESSFPAEPITATRRPSARLLREARSSSRPTLRVDPVPSSDPDVWIEETIAGVDDALEALEALEPPPAPVFAISEIYALRGRDPRSE